MARPRDDDRNDEQRNLAVNPIRPPAEGGREEVDEELALMARRRAEQRRAQRPDDTSR
jgi:hypothetical protein